MAGEAMMRDFKPIMAAESVKQTSQYAEMFKGIGTDFGPIMTAPTVERFQGYLEGLNAMSSDMRRFIAAFGRQMHMTPAQVRAHMGTHYPSLAAMLSAMPGMGADLNGMVSVMRRDVAGFAQVAPALTHFQKLIGIMQANVGNFAQADKLQPMGLLPWYFAGLGGLLILLAVALILGERRGAATRGIVEVRTAEQVRAA